MIRPSLFFNTLLGAFVVALLTTTHLFAQTIPSMPEPTDSLFQEEWKVIDSLMQEGLYRSGLEAVEELKQIAAAQGHTDHYLSAMLYVGVYLPEIEEVGMLAGIRQMIDEARQQTGVRQGVLHSVIAQLLSEHLQNEYWRIADRTYVASGDTSDITEWSIQRLEETIASYYLSSLQNKSALLQIPLGSFPKTITPGEQAEGLWPTLYDFLAHRAITYFSNSRSFLQEPVTAYLMDDPQVFAEATPFSKASFSAADSSANVFRALLLFQDVLSTRLADTDNVAGLIDADLKRLSFAYEQSVHPAKDTLYLQALVALQQRYQDHPASSEVGYVRAEWYQGKGEQYDPGVLDRNRWDLRKAVAICRACIDQFPAAYGSLRCEGLINAVQRPALDLRIEQVILPERALLLKISYKNLEGVHLRILRYTEKQYQDYQRAYGDARLSVLAEMEVVRTEYLSLPGQEDYQEHGTEQMTAGLPNGQYLLQFSKTDEFPVESSWDTGMLPFQVSGIAFMSRQTEENNTEFLVTHRATGAPLPGAEVTMLDVNNRDQWEEIGRDRTDDQGFVQSLPEGRSYVLRIEHEGDVLYSTDRFYNRNRPLPDRTSRRVSFFLDRAIYRPGQTVFFKGVALRQKGEDQPEIIPDEPVTVVLLDANYQEVTEQTFTTNEFGTFHGQFQAPTAGLNGRMQLRVKEWNSSVSFQVEEYKRPTFTVVLDSLTGSYQLGDTVRITGKAETFSGSALGGQEVTYVVNRRTRFPFYPWWRYGSYSSAGNSRQVAVGTTRTAADGTFALDFPAEPDRDIPRERNPYFTYTISVTVTDLTGETHAREERLTLSYEPFQLSVIFPEQVVRSADAVPYIQAENAAGKSLSIPFTLEVYRLEVPDRLFRERYWGQPDVWSMTEEAYRRFFPGYAYRNEDRPEAWTRSDTLTAFRLTTGASVEDWENSTLQAGHYVMAVEAEDANGRVVRREHFFQVLDREAAELPNGQVLWVAVDPLSGEPDTQIRAAIGSQETQPVLLEVERAGTIVQTQWLNAGEWPVFTYELQEEDRGNIILQYTAIFDNRTYIGNHLVQVPWTNKELDITFETFRDNLRPGQEEEWRIRISGAGTDQIAAEMVATMYDASLDDLLPHDWNWRLYPQRGYPNRTWQKRQFGDLYDQLIYSIDYGTPAGRREYPSLNWPWVSYDLFMTQPEAYEAQSVRMAQPRSAGAPPPPSPENYAVEAVGMKGTAMDSVEEEEPQEIIEEGPAPVNIRRNLDETVFFLPELYTDAQGDILLSFTMNEALTRWAFLGMAHTKDLAYGLIREEVVTQKELMVQPNAPRFVREGDTLYFTARVANLTDTVLAGTGELQLYDAITMDRVDQSFGLTVPEQTFTVDARGSALLSWKIEVPTGATSALTHRVFVRAGNFSDGEESTLPVLTNRMLVTESLPFNVRPGESKDITMTSFGESRTSSTLVPHRLTLEYTANPAWLAVKSMPYLMEYPHECSEQIFSRYYANTLASHMVESFPAIQDIFSRWREEGGLESNLARNEDLRAVLLTETPWVLDAQSEEEQRRNIALLFDLERMASELRAALAKLEENQQPSGAFPWFAGGPENRYITQHIVAGMGHLQALGILSSNELGSMDWLTRAIGYLDRTIIDQYQALKVRADSNEVDMTDDYLTGLTIHYMYTRSFFPEKVWPRELEEAMAYYQGQAETYWKRKSIYAQGMLGLDAWRTERMELADRIRASLKERGFVSEELGAYWRYQNGFRWNEHPLETHALLMEFFSNWQEDRSLVDEMKVWLLKNKQTNHWKTTKATAAAIYALLRTNDGGWLLEEQPEANIRFTEVKKNQYQPQLETAQANAEAGTGYWKARWEASEIEDDMGTFRVKNKGNVLSWGSLYWQYFEDLDKIKSFRETPLTMRKELFARVYRPEGPVLEPLKEGTSLEPGTELVVRLRIDVDRPMEYVHLKDMRAAGLEPIEVLSGYRFQAGLGYYQSTGDVATHFFMDYLPRGVHVFEYSLRVTHRGQFSNGITSLQCMYAPEFSTHSAGQRLSVDE